MDGSNIPKEKEGEEKAEKKMDETDDSKDKGVVDDDKDKPEPEYYDILMTKVPLF